MLKARTITLDDDLHRLVEEINAASWDESNDISIYDEESIKAYLAQQGTIFVACYEDSAQGPVLVGIASSRLELKPYDKERWLYVDEVDVCANQRKKGAGKLIMQTLKAIAKEHGCKELWLGAELLNDPANALYRSVGPADVSDVVGYTYKIID